MDEPKPMVEARGYVGLIDRALAAGLKPDDLGKLLDLQERWEKSRAVEAFNRAMQACQTEMPAVVKDAQGQKSMYARLESVNTLIRPVYTRNGFSITCSEAESGKEGICRINLTVRHCEGHSETVYYDIPLDGVGPKGGAQAMNATQAKGSTFSYGRRYALLCYFNVIVAGEDQDGQGPYITPEEVEEINQAIEACEAAGAPVDYNAFLRWIDVPNLADLPSRDVPKALSELRRKLKPKNGGAK
jgi:hypothetical protein